MPLIQTNIKAYYVGHNGFGSAFENVIGVVIDLNNDTMAIARVFFYFNHIAGENAQFEQFFAIMAVSHVYDKCALSGL